MTRRKNNQERTIRCATTMAVVVAAICVGCTAVPPEVQPPAAPDTPIDCNDLRIGPLSIGADPYSPVVGDNTVYADTPFGIQWFTHFVRGENENYFGFTGDYVARLFVIEDGIEIYTQDIDATPLNVASGDWDSMIVEAGLPAGTYTLRVALDPHGDVEQCNDLIFVLNNVSDAELVVESTPIDDVTNGGMGESPNRSPRDR